MKVGMTLPMRGPLANPDDIPVTYRHDDADTLTQAIDYVAGMTDRFALRCHVELLSEGPVSSAPGSPAPISG